MGDSGARRVWTVMGSSTLTNFLIALGGLAIRFKAIGGAGGAVDGDCAQGVGRQPDVEGSADPTDSGEHSADLPSAGQRSFFAHCVVTTLTWQRDLRHCAERRVSRTYPATQSTQSNRIW